VVLSGLFSGMMLHQAQTAQLTALVEGLREARCE
jgi:hypothetical protein